MDSLCIWAIVNYWQAAACRLFILIHKVADLLCTGYIVALWLAHTSVCYCVCVWAIARKKLPSNFFIHLRHIHLECHTLYYIFITVAAISFKELSSVYVHAFECQTRYAPGLLQEKSSHKVCVCGTPRCQTRGVLGYCNLL